FLSRAPTNVVYPLSLHDALPICHVPDAVDQALDDLLACVVQPPRSARQSTSHLALDAADHATDLVDRRRHSGLGAVDRVGDRGPDRKSTRLNSSHVKISYAGFCL